MMPHMKRIVGGSAATPGSWPWMVLLVDDLGYISGSGAIIGSHTIITSAQHFEGYVIDVIGTNFKLLMTMLMMTTISKMVITMKIMAMVLCLNVCY